jgi:SAM-dependent methyltransferase
MMLEAARARLPESYRVVVTDGQALAFRNGSFDAVICQLVLMFFPDPAPGLVEFRRVLPRGGRASVCVISAPEKAPMWGVPAEILSRHIPAQREALHLSFSLAHGPQIEEMFGEISVTRETRHAVIQSFDEYWAGIEAGTGQMPSIYSGLPEPERQDVREEVRAGLSQFEKNRRLEMSIEMLIATGRA